jgi:PAS domain S-box-containing protein
MSRGAGWLKVSARALLIVALYWVFEAAMDAGFFGMGDFVQALLAPQSNELWMRLTFSCVVAALVAGDYLAKVRARRLQDERRLSEQRYRSVYSMTPLAFVLWAPDCRVLDWNRRAEEIFGWEKEEVLGRDFFEFLIPEPEKPAVQELVASILETKAPTLSENRNITKDGHRLWCEWYTSLLRDEAGRVEAILSLGLDVTERRRMEEALRESEEKHRGLYEAVSGGVVVQDAQGRIVEANAEASKILGLSLDQMRGLTSADPRWRTIREDGSPFPAPERPLAVALRTGKPVRGSLSGVFNPESGRYRWVQTNAEPLLERDSGKVLGAVATFWDFTERKEAEEQLKSALKEKEALLKEVHHRVKNNLQVISALLDLKAAGLSDPEALRAFRDSQNRVRAMALIHERLYQSQGLAKMDFGAYLRGLMDHLFRAYGLEPDALQLTHEVGAETVSADAAVPIGLILNELVSNSLKHAFRDGRKGKISVGLERGTDGSWELSVADDGPGLPPGLDFRATETLGLQLVCILVRQIGGGIERLPGPGTGFKVTFKDPPGRPMMAP